MAENVLPDDPHGSAHRRRSKRLSIDYDDNDVPANLRHRQALGDITNVHNLQRNEKQKGKNTQAANRKLRKTGDSNLTDGKGVLTRSRKQQFPKTHIHSCRRSDVPIGITDMAMEDDESEEGDSSCSEELTKPDEFDQFSVCNAPPMPDLWGSETDPTYDYADEIYKNLRENEVKFLPRDDYMTTMQSDINHTMRSILVDWLVEVGEEYKLSSQTLFLTINYIDRLLSKVSVNRSKLQLLGITCMLIAAKYEEIYPPSIDEFVYISDNTYTRDEVLTMESVIITSLKFHLTAATPWEFCRRYSKAIDLRDKPRLLADFLCEVFLLEPCSLKYTPSIVASSAIFLALYTLNYPAWTPTLIQASGYQFEDLRPCVQDLLVAHQKMCAGDSNNLKAIREKYKEEEKYMAVAVIPPKPALIF